MKAFQDASWLCNFLVFTGIISSIIFLGIGTIAVVIANLNRNKFQENNGYLDANYNSDGFQSEGGQSNFIIPTQSSEIINTIWFNSTENYDTKWSNPNDTNPADIPEIVEAKNNSRTHRIQEEENDNGQGTGQLGMASMTEIENPKLEDLINNENIDAPIILDMLGNRINEDDLTEEIIQPIEENNIKPRSTTYASLLAEIQELEKQEQENQRSLELSRLQNSQRTNANLNSNIQNSKIPSGTVDIRGCILNEEIFGLADPATRLAWAEQCENVEIGCQFNGSNCVCGEDVCDF